LQQLHGVFENLISLTAVIEAMPPKDKGVSPQVQPEQFAFFSIVTFKKTLVI